MRILFAGSPAAAVPTLESVESSRHELVGVFSQPARPAGRKKIVTETPVVTAARRLGIPVETPATSQRIIEILDSWKPEIAIVFAFGRIISTEERSAVPLGWWNVHLSLLPSWRGAAPVPHSLAAGDTSTGITVFRIEDGIDTGPVARSSRLEISPDDTSSTLLSKLGHLAPAEVVGFLEDAAENQISVKAQSGSVSLAPKPVSSVGKIDWSADAITIDRAIRAWSLEPGCFAVRADNGQTVKIFGARGPQTVASLTPGELAPHVEGMLVGTGSSPILITRVQPSGKNIMASADWLRGLTKGAKFRVKT